MNPFFNSFYKKHVPKKMPFVGNNPNFRSINTEILFDSKFESGNLDCAVNVANDEYDLFMRVDTNTRGHCH